jgi:hypothetical protein
MKNRHGNGRFAPGESLGTYRGQMRHDPSTEAIKTRLHTAGSRKVVAAHVGTQSVSTDAGAKPHAHDTAGPNASANAATNAKLAHAGRAAPTSTNAAQDVAAGLTGRQFTTGLPSPTE